MRKGVKALFSLTPHPFFALSLLAASAAWSQDFLSRGPQFRFDVPAMVEVLTTEHTEAEALDNFRSLMATSVFPALPIPNALYATLQWDDHADVDPVRDFWKYVSSKRIQFQDDGKPVLDSKPVRPEALSALWTLVPELTFKATKDILTLESCRKVAPLLSVMVAMGLNLAPQRYHPLHFTRKDFARWMEVYLTLGNRLEMSGGGNLIGVAVPDYETGLGSCDAALAYMQFMMPGISGLPFHSAVIIMASTQRETYVLAAPEAGREYAAEFRFWRKTGPHGEVLKAQFHKFK